MDLHLPGSSSSFLLPVAAVFAPWGVRVAMKVEHERSKAIQNTHAHGGTK